MNKEIDRRFTRYNVSAIYTNPKDTYGEYP